VLVAAAAVVHLTTPSDEEVVAPLVVRADPGEWAQGRTFGVRVDDVGLAAEVTDGLWTGSTEGVWVVATATAEATGEPGTLSASLVLGDEVFDASDRAGSSALTGEILSPGFPRRGGLLFEVPAGALAEHGAEARLQLASRLNPRLDSMVEVEVDLADVAVEDLRQLDLVEGGER
jgi:hypothetical protein